MDALLRVTAAHGLPVIEDVCKARGSRYQSRLAESSGWRGCFSLKDGKLAPCAEGGYLLTSDPQLAARPAAIRIQEAREHPVTLGCLSPWCPCYRFP